ncbi:glycosyl transferase [Marivirga tractuosa]|uniref:Glycosyl transferase group 1 n=1 Tax=Marivirga tractuosa (strain ATCC 23168 / DSM 4126 / NBRC 15989 / NCIMB 1408 / VKM B-1430 / H-43) TaxID=643867 RepID=E4TS76_MARTH|nr:glycosyltransferase family 4 protein [Marivirga tractuosa]ADR21816.1 glycosyl transferase group 1 [Marivirga tractuosa DSM 4126]BDD13726.1 glycosyl transferase [Marivirga tractuosa]
MKILVISNFRSIVTVRPEAEIFIGLAKKGHDITVMTYKESEYIPRFEEHGIKVILFHPEKKRDKESIAFIREELVRGKYDVLQMYNSLAYLSGIPAAKGLPVKVILYRGYTGNIAWYDPFIYFKYFNKTVDAVICNVKAIEELFLKNYFGNRIIFKTINKGHDISWYQVEEKADLSGYTQKPDNVKFICTANDRKMKGVKYLLKATHYLDKDAPFELFLAGRNMDRPEFLKLINDSPVKDKIHILGFRKDILEVENNCDVFVLASLYGESITKAAIEAMGLGKAPLITDIPGNRKLVISGESGIVVPKANAKSLAEGMKKYIYNPDLISKYGKAAQNRIQTVFHTSKTVEEYDKFYKELIVN